MAAKRTAARPREFADTPLAMFDFGSIIDANERGVTAFIDLNSHIVDRMTRMTHQMIGFVDKRLNEDADLAKRLMACDNPPEAVAIYGSFFQTALKDYADEFGRMAALCTDMTSETMEEAEKKLEETIETLEPAEFADAGSK